jgi:hypothetical protein
MATAMGFMTRAILPAAWRPYLQWCLETAEARNGGSDEMENLTPSKVDSLDLLLTCIASHDTDAFALLYDHTVPWIWTAISDPVDRDRRETLELAIAVFEEIWVQAPRYQSGKDCPVAWILHLVRTAGDSGSSHSRTR